MRSIILICFVCLQSTPEDFSPKSRRVNNDITENNHHHHHHSENNERGDRSNRSTPGEDVKSEPIDNCPNIEVDNDDSNDGRRASSIASGQDETDSSAQGTPTHFHSASVQDKLQSFLSAGSSPSQAAFNFNNLPISRQALSDAVSITGNNCE
jgi:hypothetical protein